MCFLSPNGVKEQTQGEKSSSYLILVISSSDSSWTHLSCFILFPGSAMPGRGLNCKAGLGRDVNMLGQKPCQRANCVSGAPCKVFSMFSEAPDAAVRRLLVVLFVPTQQMFSGSVVCTVFCVQRTAGIVLFFCYSDFGDTSVLFGPSVNARVPIVYCQWQHCYVCSLHRVCAYAYSALASCCFNALCPG